MDDEIDDLVDAWHSGLCGNVKMCVFLGWSDTQYGRWLSDVDDVDEHMAAAVHRRWQEEFGS